MPSQGRETSPAFLMDYTYNFYLIVLISALWILFHD